MKLVVALLTAMLLIGGCAAPAPRDEPPTPEETRLAISRDSVVFPRVDGWSQLPREFIAVRTIDDRFFLLTLELACSEAFRIGSEIAIAVEQQTRNTLHRFDELRIGDRNCRIQTIQPLDADGIHAAMQAAGLEDHFIARGVD